MGGGNSKSNVIQDLTNDIQQTVTQSCPMSECSASMENMAITIGGIGQRVNASQICKASSDCVLDAALNASSKMLSGADSSVTAGLGFLSGDSDNNVILQNRQQMKNKIEAACKGVKSSSKKKNMPVTIGGLWNSVDVSQTGDAKSTCKMKHLMDTTSEIVAQSKQTTEGASLFNFGGMGMGGSGSSSLSSILSCGIIFYMLLSD